MSSSGVRLDASAKVDITDAQTAVFDYGDLQVVWTHRDFGAAPDPSYPWGATFYGEKATLKASVMRYDLVPSDGTRAAHREVAYELDRFPEDRTEPDLEQHVAPALRAHLANFLECVRTRQRPVADVEEGYLSTTACILANLSMQTGRTLEWDAATGRVKGDDEANALLRRPVPRAVGPPGPGGLHFLARPASPRTRARRGPRASAASSDRRRRSTRGRTSPRRRRSAAWP